MAKKKEVPSNNFEDAPMEGGSEVVSEGLADDPVSEYVIKNWKNLLGAALAVVVVLFAKQRFDEAALNKRISASQIFTNIQHSYKDFTDLEEGEEKEKKRISLNEMIAALESSEEPYKSLAGIYRSLISGSTDQLSPAPSDSKEGLDGFSSEISRLALAKKALDNESTREEGLTELRKLAESGQFVREAAERTLALVNNP